MPKPTVELKPASLAACDESWSFLQSGFWASFKAEFGWKPRPFLLAVEGRDPKPFLVMERSLKAGLRFAYAPHGPELEPVSASTSGEAESRLLAASALAAKSELSPSCVFLRFDPPWYLAEAPRSDSESPEGDTMEVTSLAGSLRGFHEPDRPSLAAPLRKAAADVQPPDTVLLDLVKAEEELLAGMKPKWRYNIRLAEKKGVLVTEESPLSGQGWKDALAGFYRLYRETSERDRIALHPERYYRRLFELAADGAGGREAGKQVDLRVWTARHEGEALASIITVFWGGQAIYLYGASSNEKRNLMPAYALQWSAIKAAKAAGCSQYDFFGIPPNDDPDHAMAGLYRFKTGFGGSIVHRAGSWDYALRPAFYGAFRSAEALRNWYYKDFRKRRQG